MNLSRRLLALSVLVAALCFCSTAAASDVMIGPGLPGSGWISEECGTAACTVVNYELGTTGATLTSPVTGAVVSFGVYGGSTPGTYRLRTVTPSSSSTLWFFNKSATAVPVVPNPGVQTYATTLPIIAGQTVALTMSGTASIGFVEDVGRSTEWWLTEPPESGHQLGTSFPGVFAFNAEVQPAPTIASLGTSSGPTGALTSVTITGTDLENTTGVTFGSAPASSFSAVSETTLTAVAPANTTPGAVPVSVTTVAGKATAVQTFTYVTPPPPAPKCVVPKLKAKKLKAAKKALQSARCKLGKVKKAEGATSKTGEVSGQGKKPGAKLVAGTKVNVTLKP